MLSIKPIGSSQGEVSYYAHLGAEDYYFSGGEPPGVWWGEGAKSLGLDGQVTADEFGNLLKGYDADGRKSLVQNAGARERRSAFDLTWTVPKSVSVAWSQGDEAIRKSIETAGQRAVDRVLQVLDRYCGVTRRGRHGEQVERAGLAAAIFRHDTARALEGELPDPNLHWHVVLLNLSTREDGTTGALDARSLFRPHMKMALGALFRAELSKELGLLGLESFRPQRNGKLVSWFELTGIPEGLIDEFSKRRKQIVDWMAERGLSGARAAEQANNATRRGKQSLVRTELLNAWREIGNSYRLDIDDLVRNDLRPQSVTHFEVLQAAEEVTQSQSHFSDIELLRRAAENAQGKGIGIDELERVVAQTIDFSDEIVTLNENLGQPRFTTRAMLALERQLIEAVERARDWSPSAREDQIQLAFSHRPTLRPEQRAAVEHLTLSSSRIACVNGMAGTGKTFMLDAAREIWEAAGYQVLGTTLAAKAAQALEEGSMIRSLHVHSLLQRLERGQEQLGENSILVVDEAGMLGTMMLERLVSLTETANARLVLVGDYRQLQAIDAGGPFRAVCERLGAANLREITRQREEWAREAVAEMASGDADMALSKFHQRGLLVVGNDRAHAMQALVDDWHRYGTVKDSLIFAGTRVETATLNRLCQQLRQNQGELGTESIDLDRDTIFVGDRVVFTKNNASLLVRNGNCGTVVDVRPEQNLVRVELDSGYRVAVALDHYPHLALGYAVTVHKGQGQTVESAFVLAGGGMTDRELAYVQTSRSRGDTRIYTDVVSAGERLENLSRQMQRSRAKDLAHDYLIEAA